MESNAMGMDAAAVEAASLAYGLSQFGLGLATDQFPNSGFGAAAVGSPGCGSGADGASASAVARREIAATSPTAQPASGHQSTYGDMLPHTAARAAFNAVGEVADGLVATGLRRRADQRQAERAVAELRSATGVDEVIRSQTATVQQLWRAAEGHEASGIEQGLDGPDLVQYVQERMTEEVDRAAVGLQQWARVHWPSRTEVLDQFLTTNAARTTAFNTAYAVGLVADGLLPASITGAARSAILNSVVGGLMYRVHSAFTWMHNTRAFEPAVGDERRPVPPGTAELRRRQLPQPPHSPRP